MPTNTLQLRLFVVLFLLFLVSAAQAELIFGATVGSPSNPDFQIFRASNGNVVAVPSNLPQPMFPSLSPAGNELLLSSIDPAQPHEASQDLFVLNLQNGQRRRIVDNQTVPNPGGGFDFATPLWSAMSGNSQLVAFVNQVSSTSGDPLSGGVRQLRVIRASDGFNIALAEIGNGAALDFFQSEFVGISWLPGTEAFATPAYVQITNNIGEPLWAAGIVLFAPVGPAGQPYVRAQLLTLPSAFANPPFGNIIQTHAYPSFSPNGLEMAFFRITFPRPDMAAAASAELIVINTQTGNGQVIANFNPGVFPAGISWRNNSQLVFSLGNQTQSGGLFLPTIDPTSAQIFTIPAGGGGIGQVPGVNHGFFPNGVPPSEVIFRSNFQ